MQSSYSAPVLEVVGSVADLTGGYATGPYCDTKGGYGFLHPECSS